MRIPVRNSLYGILVFIFSCSLTIFSDAKPYKAAEILTKQQNKYGKYVVRMRAAKGSGIISNFFTYKNGSEKADVFWEEIDVEVFGKNNSMSWQSNIITGLGSRDTSEGVHNGENFADGYNTFTMEWTPTYVRWLVNGVEKRRTNGGQARQLSNAASFRFNIWNPNIPQWVGPWNPNILPVHMFVNWVEYHSWNGNGFTLKWRDNFDSFNSNRWGKANHTFAENQADFIPQNANVKNGYLVLSLTREGQEGYNGNPPMDNGSSNNNTTIPPTGWTNLQVQHSSRCLDVKGGRKDNTSTYQQWACDTNNINQRFKFEGIGSGFYNIRAQVSNKCIDNSSGSRANGNKIQQYACSLDNDNQAWRLENKGNGWFEIRNKRTNKCLDIAEFSQKNGGVIHQWQCLAGNNQLFRFK